MAIDKPDWDRYVTRAAPSHIRVGDPLRWGATIVQQVPAGFLLTNTQEFIRARTSDAYARAWTISGTLRLPFALWTASPFPTAIWLEVASGVGQAQMIQRIALAMETFVVGPAHGVGLCFSQNVFTNDLAGVYAPDPAIGTTDEARPFSLVGAIVAQSIGVRASFLSSPAGYTAELSVGVTPLAPGQGL